MAEHTNNPNSTARDHLYPAFLKLDGKACVIVGGGKVARRKAESLMACGARVSVVSPEADEQIAEWHGRGLLDWRKKRFEAADLKGALLVFAATDSAEENRAVADTARAQGALVNSADDPSRCDFLVPSVLRRGALSVAVATDGKSPLFARRVRKELEEILPEAYGEFLEILGEQRDFLKETVPDEQARRKLFESLVYSDILELLKKGMRKEAEEKVKQCISSLQD